MESMKSSDLSELALLVCFVGVSRAWFDRQSADGTSLLAGLGYVAFRKGCELDSKKCELDDVAQTDAASTQCFHLSGCIGLGPKTCGVAAMGRPRL